MVQFHCFTDGNKRTAILSTSLFLERNEIEIADFEIKMEDIAIGIARKDLDKKDLQKIFKAMFESFGYKVN